MKKTIFISAGSSGGHIYPAITLANKLKELHHDVYFIASSNRIEGSILPQHGYDILNVTSPTVRKPFKGFLLFIKELIQSFKETHSHVKKYHPDMMISFGGSISFASGWVSFFNRVPLYIHEQNAVLGLSNEWIAPVAKKILTQFNIEKSIFKSKMVVVGSPRTSEFKSYQPNPKVFTDLGFDPSKSCVVFVMGSLGSYTMQKMIADMIVQFPEVDYQRLFITGTRFYDSYHHLNDLNSKTVVVPSISLIDLYSNITLLVSRGGATTMAEVIGSNTPTLFIPSPYVTRNHQFLNAQSLQKALAAEILDEREINVEVLYHAINAIVHDDEKLNAMKNALKSLSQLDELDQIVKELDL